MVIVHQLHGYGVRTGSYIGEGIGGGGNMRPDAAGRDGRLTRRSGGIDIQVEVQVPFTRHVSLTLLVHHTEVGYLGINGDIPC